MQLTLTTVTQIVNNNGAHRSLPDVGLPMAKVRARHGATGRVDPIEIEHMALAEAIFLENL
jgi:hypothetical protein